MTNSACLPRSTLQTSLQWIAFLLLVFGALVLLMTNPAQAQTYTILHAFNGLDGYYPETGLTSDADGNFYGTTYYGGSSQNCFNGCGTVFKLTHHSGGWVLTTIYEFQGGSGPARPDSAVVIGLDGTLYGTTSGWGQYGDGTVYNLRPPANVCASADCLWTMTVLHSFTNGSDGGYPGYGSLVFDQQGNLYGTAVAGGTYGEGVVFEFTPSDGGWTESVIYIFGTNQAVECGPSGVIFDHSGNLWGTAEGCSGQYGAVFKLTPSGSSWTASLIHKFQDTLFGNTPDGAFPLESLTLDSSGNLYGTTLVGPPYPVCPSLGTVFEINTAGEFATLHFFPSYPSPECNEESGLLGPVTVDAQGNLYGTQYGDPYGSDYGGIYQGGPLGWSELINLSPTNDGYGPWGGVVLDANGNLYGTASGGGPGGGGVVWEITP